MKRSLNTTVTLNNGIKMPQFGFGTVRLAQSDDEKKFIILQAIKTGFRKFDSAARYDSEKALGEAIKESGIPREDFFIGTKIWSTDMGKDRVKEAFEESLEKLQMDYVDIYMIHWPVPHKYLVTWQKMIEIYESGKAHAIGVSNFNVEQLTTLYEKTRIMPAVNQMECHPTYQRLMIREYCQKHGIFLEAYQPLAHGLYLKNPIVEEISKKHKKTATQVVIRWHLQTGIVPIPRSSSFEHIQENIDIFDFELDTDDMNALNALNVERSVNNFAPNCMDPSFFTY